MAAITASTLNTTLACQRSANTGFDSPSFCSCDFSSRCTPYRSSDAVSDCSLPVASVRREGWRRYPSALPFFPARRNPSLIAANETAADNPSTRCARRAVVSLGSVATAPNSYRGCRIAVGGTRLCPVASTSCRTATAYPDFCTWASASMSLNPGMRGSRELNCS